MKKSKYRQSDLNKLYSEDRERLLAALREMYSGLSHSNNPYNTLEEIFENLNLGSDSGVITSEMIEAMTYIDDVINLELQNINGKKLNHYLLNYFNKVSKKTSIELIGKHYKKILFLIGVGGSVAAAAPTTAILAASGSLFIFQKLMKEQIGFKKYDADKDEFIEGIVKRWSKIKGNGVELSALDALRYKAYALDESINKRKYGIEFSNQRESNIVFLFKKCWTDATRFMFNFLTWHSGGNKKINRELRKAENLFYEHFGGFAGIKSNLIPVVDEVYHEYMGKNLEEYTFYLMDKVRYLDDKLKEKKEFIYYKKDVFNNELISVSQDIRDLNLELNSVMKELEKISITEGIKRVEGEENALTYAGASRIAGLFLNAYQKDNVILNKNNLERELLNQRKSAAIQMISGEMASALGLNIKDDYSRKEYQEVMAALFVSSSRKDAVDKIMAVMGADVQRREFLELRSTDEIKVFYIEKIIDNYFNIMDRYNSGLDIVQNFVEKTNKRVEESKRSSFRGNRKN